MVHILEPKDCTKARKWNYASVPLLIAISNHECDAPLLLSFLIKLSVILTSKKKYNAFQIEVQTYEG